MRSLIKISLLLLLFSGCSEDEAMLCDTGPVVFPFELVDTLTEENVFEAGILTRNQLDIKDEEGKIQDFELRKGVIQVLLGWGERSDTFTVSIDDKPAFNIVFRLEVVSGESCSSTRLADLEIAGTSSEKDETSGITTVFVAFAEVEN